MSAIDARELRRAYGKFLTGVTVVTALSADGRPVGFTANSYTSVSLNPPLLLVCPAHSLSSYPVFEACQSFVVNILAADQQDIANTFASASNDRFANIQWHANAAGCPVIRGTAATFSCTTHNRIPAGDHLILVGEVEQFEANDNDALGYSNGGYFSLELERKAAELAPPTHSVTVGAIVEHAGQVLVQETANGLRLPQVEVKGMMGSLAVLSTHLEQAGMALEFGPVYSVFQGRGNAESSTYYRATAANKNPCGMGVFVPVDALASRQFTTGAVTDMVRRYVLEWQGGIFQLYLGDEVEGDVHMFGEPPGP